MDKYKPTIGLEIHVELKTETKMFCSCKNDPDEERPNVNICPVCMAHPGSLPVINKKAVESVLKVGLAIGGKLADETEFDRKNYFYPDIPKGYQISQYKNPLVMGGELAGVKITRVHLEEDTATSIHVVDPEQSEGKGYSLVDFNRAGVPLMELVTEPVVHSSHEAVKFGKELQLLLQYIGVAEANMEKGEMRFEANISVSDGEELGTKVEVKNLNSFKAAERAIDYEIKRQSLLLEKGEKVAQETRGWNEARQETFSQRSKETAHDYRYFPDPDLPKLKISLIEEFSDKSLSSKIPETPSQKRERFSQNFAIKDSDVEFYINNIKLADLFESASEIFKKSGGKEIQTLSNYIVSDISSMGDKGFSIKPEALSEVILMYEDGSLSSRGAKDLLAVIAIEGGDPRKLAEEKGLLQKSDKDELIKLAQIVFEKNQGVVSEYKAGKLSGLQFLIGQMMKEAKGSGNPLLIKAILEDLLK